MKHIKYFLVGLFFMAVAVAAFIGLVALSTYVGYEDFFGYSFTTILGMTGAYHIYLAGRGIFGE